jgi:hypothetical protein
MMTSWKIRFGTFVAVLAMALPAAAQETRGSIEGLVKDGTGGVLPGVTVQAVQRSTSAKASAVTDANGIYRFPSLAPGVYAVSATLTGFKAASVDEVAVAVGKVLSVNMTMTLASMALSETVRAEAPVIDIKQNSVTATVTSELIDLLPKGRDYLSALTGIPGTNYETDVSGSRASGLMIDGAAQSENRFILDGQDTTNLRTGTSGKEVTVDFVEQIQVKQSGYSAEFRATTGGVVSVITKSGTNSYHGGFGADYRGKMLNGLMGNVRQELRLSTTVSGNVVPAEYFTTPRTAEYERYTLEPITQIGGPVLKNRAWFFAGFTPLITNQDRTVQWPNPGIYPAIQTFNAKSTDTRGLYNGTIQIAQNLRARVSGNNQRTSAALSLPGIDTSTFVVGDDGSTIAMAASNVNVATFQNRSQVHQVNANDSYAATADWTIDNRTFASVTGGYLATKSRDTGGDYNHSIRRSFGASNIGLLDVPANLQFANGYTDSTTNSFRIQDDYYRWNISGDVTRYVSWKGQHAFKGGLQYERLANDVNFGDQYPNVNLLWNQTRTTLDQRSVRGAYGYYTVLQNYTIGTIHSNNIGLFIQDQWGVNSRLTINYGVRSDYTDIPSYRPENDGLKFGFKDKLAPRLGFAYDLKGNGKWKLFGSTGIFYDIEKLEMPRGAWGADHRVTYYWTLDSYDWPSISCDGSPTSGCPGTYIEQNDLRHVSNERGNSLVDPNLKPYKSGELVFGVDHELSRLISVGTRYVHKWVFNAIEDVGVQVVGLGELFYIANPGDGYGAYPLTEDFARQPHPIRDYDSFEFSLNRRYSNNWSLSSSIVFSRLYGNYSGLSNSGSESNRNSPNVTRLFDGLFMSFTEQGCPNLDDCTGYEAYGRLGTDRPVQFKSSFVYRLPWTGTTAGVTFVGQSGNLQTSSVTYKAVPVQLYGLGDLGTTPVYTNTDLLFTQPLNLPRNMKATLQFNITNLFDQEFVTTNFTSPWRDALVIAGDSCTFCAAPFFAGFDAVAVQAARNAANANVSRTDARYGLANGFRGARSARVYVKFDF